MGNGLVGAICSGAEHLNKKKLVYLREMKIYLHPPTNLYILARVSTAS